MRVYLTGATGFVGSNLARVLSERHGAELHCPVHRHPPPATASYSSERVDLTDARGVRASVARARPDAIVHAAILNDLTALRADRRAAWSSYVEATRNLVDAANAAGAGIVLVSTDWVFDGSQPGAAEDTPPNPINLYGFLKAASELVVSERAERGAVARIAGVQGVHWARPELPRAQDEGFGYFVAALTTDLRAGQPFGVWESPRINMVATPTLASDAASLIWRIAAAGLRGTFHACGGEALDRAGLARQAATVLQLDPDLVHAADYPLGEPPMPVPFDTSLDAGATARELGVTLPSADEWLARLAAELETGELGPDPFPATPTLVGGEVNR